MRRYLHYICLLLISALFFIFAACSVVGVEHISKEEWLKNRMTNALNSNSLSNDTRSVMEQAGISDKYADDPKAAIAELQAMFDAAKTPSYAAALAEMCYLQGKNDDSIRYYMSSIFFSLQYLGMAGAHYDGLSAKSNTVAVYYNFSLLEVFKFLKDHNLLQFKSYQIPSIYGDITFSAPEFHKAITDEWIRALIPVYELHPVGLRVYSFKAGIGLPLAESVDILKEVSEGKDIVLNPVTMILSIQTKDGCPLGARLEFFDPLKTENVSIEGKEFPLESDYTTPLAEVLNNPPLIKGIEFMLFPDDIGTYSGLYMMFDYDPDKIPVVFVHGLMSNPRTWSKALNSLLDDPVIRKHYQFWAFAYATGDPVIYSAALLRKDLLEKQKKYSPDGNNPNFNKMVIVSHSMGGLVSSLMVKDSGQALSDKLLDVPIDKLNIKPEQKEFLLEMLVFKSLPFIKTVVFISVPHRGSELATYDVVIDAAKFIVLTCRPTLRSLQQSTCQDENT